MTDVWLSICSMHQVFDADCRLCNRGQWVSQEELDEDHALYVSDYPAWFKKNNPHLR